MGLSVAVRGLWGRGILLVALIAYAVIIFFFVFSPGLNLLLPLFVVLFLLVATSYFVSSRPYLFSRYTVEIRGIIGEEAQIHVLELFIEKAMREDDAFQVENARMSVYKDEVRLGFYKQDFRFLRINLERESGLFTLKIRQANPKRARTSASIAIEKLRDSAAEAGTRLKVLSVHPHNSDDTQQPLIS